MILKFGVENSCFDRIGKIQILQVIPSAGVKLSMKPI